MAMMPRAWIEQSAALFLLMHLVVRIVICPILEYGQTIQNRLLLNMVFLKRMQRFSEEIVQESPRINEDTMPGELANVVAGRVANLLDLQGPNYATDAACASSMAAVLDACRLLQSRQVDMMLAGASDRTMDPATYAKFSAIGALSPSHSTPFDAKANGFVMGEGAGVVVLKRLHDAIKDGDTIYGVVRGIGSSSDGRGKGITAPSQRGQVQAIARAYQQAQYDPASVELVEAHGTSTKVGDATELSTLSTLWKGFEKETTLLSARLSLKLVI